MKSTPAVFCAPSISAMSTPCISTPAAFQNEPYPWAVKTPEASPMCLGVVPLCGAHAYDLPSVEPVISRELLRSVCEPFFEQMLTALQLALQQEQKRPCGDGTGIPQTMAQSTKGTCFQSVFSSTSMTMHQRTHLEPMPDDESTEADELGAFASLLSGPSSEGEGFDMAEAKLYGTEVLAPPARTPIPSEDSEPSDPEKTIMVCRHWRSKGWCRLEANCKFLHPEHKRGVTAPKASNGGSNSGGCISGAACPGMSAALSLSDMIGLEGEVSPAALPRRKKRGGRDKSSRAQQVQLHCLEQEVTQLQRHSQRAEDQNVHSP